MDFCRVASLPNQLENCDTLKGYSPTTTTTSTTTTTTTYTLKPKSSESKPPHYLRPTQYSFNKMNHSRPSLRTTDSCVRKSSTIVLHSSSSSISNDPGSPKEDVSSLRRTTISLNNSMSETVYDEIQGRNLPMGVQLQKLSRHINRSPAQPNAMVDDPNGNFDPIFKPSTLNNHNKIDSGDILHVQKIHQPDAEPNIFPPCPIINRVTNAVDQKCKVSKIIENFQNRIEFFHQKNAIDNSNDFKNVSTPPFQSPLQLNDGMQFDPARRAASKCVERERGRISVRQPPKNFVNFGVRIGKDLTAPVQNQSIFVHQESNVSSNAPSVLEQNIGDSNNALEGYNIKIDGSKLQEPSATFAQSEKALVSNIVMNIETRLPSNASVCESSNGKKYIIEESSGLLKIDNKPENLILPSTTASIKSQGLFIRSLKLDNSENSLVNVIDKVRINDADTAIISVDADSNNSPDFSHYCIGQGIGIETGTIMNECDFIVERKGQLQCSAEIKNTCKDTSKTFEYQQNELGINKSSKSAGKRLTGWLSYFYSRSGTTSKGSKVNAVSIENFKNVLNESITPPSPPDSVKDLECKPEKKLKGILKYDSNFDETCQFPPPIQKASFLRNEEAMRMRRYANMILNNKPKTSILAGGKDLEQPNDSSKQKKPTQLETTLTRNNREGRIRFDLARTTQHQTYSKGEYERGGVEYIAKSLSYESALMIKRELNELKKHMPVHDESRCYTQFYPLR